ncbi:DUF3592 domain-containing protein [Spirosoma aerophilum]
MDNQVDVKGKAGLLFLGVFALVGIGLLGGSYYSWQYTQRIMKAGVEAKGVVIDTRYSRDKNGRTTSAQAPVVQFVTAEGKPVTYYSQTYTTPASFDVGETVTLWYMPEKPQEDVILDGMTTWILPAVLGGMGVIFSLIGLPGLIRSLFR